MLGNTPPGASRRRHGGPHENGQGTLIPRRRSMYKSYRKAMLMVLLAVGTTAAEDGAKPGTASQGIEWVTQYGAARRLSSQTNRPVLLFLSTDGCVHCTRME